jgi:hypothetical protein
MNGPGDIVSLADAVAASLDPRTLSGLWAIYNARRYSSVRARNTAENYGTAMRCALAMLPERPHAGDIETWLVKLVNDGAPGRGPLSSATANNYLRCVRAVTMKAGKAGGDIVVGLAFAAADELPEDDKPVRLPPPDCLERSIAAALNPAEVAWLLILARCAARRDEARALIHSDYSRHAGELTFYRTHGSKSRKNRHAVKFKLDDLTRACVEWTIANNGVVRPRGGPPTKGADVKVFPWGLGYVERFAERVRASFGGEVNDYFPPGDMWHVFRHLAASTVGDATGSVIEVMRVLGDRSPARAMGYYRNLDAVPTAGVQAFAGDTVPTSSGSRAPVQKRLPLPAVTGRALPPLGPVRIEGERGFFSLDGAGRLTPLGAGAGPPAGATGPPPDTPDPSMLVLWEALEGSLAGPTSSPPTAAQAPVSDSLEEDNPWLALVGREDKRR